MTYDHDSLFRHTFGQPRLRGATIEQIDGWAERLLWAPSLDEALR